MTSGEVGIHVCAHLSISSEIDVCSEVCSSIDPLNVYSIEIAEPGTRVGSRGPTWFLS